jgi:hypothetical protein
MPEKMTMTAVRRFRLNGTSNGRNLNYQGSTVCLYCLHPVAHHDWWVSGRQHNNKNKPIELLTLVLFDSCYMFQSA